jgi:membrane-bound metal-dependent hydrolase YbcI (DUF457 family)
MPTPLGHALAGVAIRIAAGPQAGPAWSSILILAVAGNLPDLDFLFGYWLSHPGAYHRGPTHSLAASVVVGGIVGGLIGARTGKRLASLALVTVGYASHLLLDMLLGQADLAHQGLQLLWPFSTERVALPWSVFKMAPISVRTNPLATLFSVDILPVVARELMVMVPVMLVSWAVTRPYRLANSSTEK